jgi:hypothetical protein
LDLYGSRAIAFAQMAHGDQMALISAHLRLSEYTPSRFLADYAWIVLSSGFSAQVMGKKFQEVGKILRGFDPAKINRSVLEKGVGLINHRAKWDAILQTAWLLKSNGWDLFRETYLVSLETMRKLPRIGQVTQYRLAICLGMDMATPSEALDLIGEHFEVRDPQLLCRQVKIRVREARDLYLCQIDFALWCYLSHSGKLQPCCFSAGEGP